MSKNKKIEYPKIDISENRSVDVNSEKLKESLKQENNTNVNIKKIEETNRKLVIVYKKISNPKFKLTEEYKHLVKERIDYANDAISYIYSEYEGEIKVPDILIGKLQHIISIIMRIQSILYTDDLRKIQNKHSEFQNQMRNQISKAETNNNRANKLIIQLQQKVNPLVDKMESIWSNILNFIITYTIATTALSAIDNIDVIYIPAFVSGLVFLGITCVAFTSLIFKKDKENLKKNIYIDSAMKIYYITLIIFIGTSISTMIGYFVK